MMPNCEYLELRLQPKSWLAGGIDRWTEIPRVCSLDDSFDPGEWFCTEYTVLSPSTPKAMKSKATRKDQLKEFWLKSDRAISEGMPVLSVDEINAEVSELRGNTKGDL